MGNVRKIPDLIHRSKYFGFAIRFSHAILTDRMECIVVSLLLTVNLLTRRKVSPVFY